jgi:uncharacterized protein (TIGR03083 family)
MESTRLRDCLEADFRRLREVAVSSDLRAPVPSCPGWTMTDLLHHLGEVYLDKVECMRHGRSPEPWPPPELRTEPPLQLLDRAYAALTAEFSARRPEDHAFTWYPPDQSVGFWIRRMAQETVIHRVDAELASGDQVAEIPDDLAADGIDELLIAFVQYATATWPEDFPELAALAGGRTAAVTTPARTWLLRLASTGVRAGPGSTGSTASPEATIAGPAPEVLLWLWNRGGQGATATGDGEMITLLRKVLVASTQ